MPSVVLIVPIVELIGRDYVTKHQITGDNVLNKDIQL